jgi:hypothetical protein
LILLRKSDKSPVENSEGLVYFTYYGEVLSRECIGYNGNIILNDIL